MLWIAVGPVCIVCLYFLMIMPRMLRRPAFADFKGVLFAHRGLHDNKSDAPENSMKAFEKAVNAGYGIELDVRLTKDGIPVVFHDATLERMCKDAGRVDEYTYEELKAFTLLESKESIPLFTDFLEMVKGRVPLLIEYKCADANTRVCAVCEEILKGYEGKYCIESFNPFVLWWYRLHRKKVARGILSNSFWKEDPKENRGIQYFFMHHLLLNWMMKPDFIAYHYIYYKDVSRKLCKNLYRLPQAAWTIRSRQALSECRKEFDMFIFDSFVPEKKEI